jgi:hypothetical protein
MSKTAETRAQAREAMWKERVKQWRESGESAKEFSQKRGCSSSALHWWARWFSKTETLELVRVMPKPVAAAATLAPVVSPITLELRGIQIRVGPGFDARLLAQVMQALDGGAP